MVMLAFLITSPQRLYSEATNFCVSSGVALVESGELRPMPLEAAIARARDLAQRRRAQEP